MISALRMGVVIAICAVVAGAQETPPPAMATDATPTFEVATIKPSLPEERRAVMVSGTRLQTTAMTLADLMTFSYSVHSLQIMGGPQWARSDRYDVVIVPNLTGRPSTAQMRAIVQKLLTDRFHLKMHHASQELEVYAIEPAKHGAHLTPVTKEEVAGNTAAVAFAPGKMMVANATVAEFANALNRYAQLQWPAVDDSKIAGKFDFKLEWTPEEARIDRAAVPPAAAPDLFAAMDEQLGLEMKARREPADVLVIDEVERPSDN